MTISAGPKPARNLPQRQRHATYKPPWPAAASVFVLNGFPVKVVPGGRKPISIKSKTYRQIFPWYNTSITLFTAYLGFDPASAHDAGCRSVSRSAHRLGSRRGSIKGISCFKLGLEVKQGPVIRYNRQLCLTVGWRRLSSKPKHQSLNLVLRHAKVVCNVSLGEALSP